jgi:hypothetical protein
MITSVFYRNRFLVKTFWFTVYKDIVTNTVYVKYCILYSYQNRNGDQISGYLELQQQDPRLLKEVGDLSASCYTHKPLHTGIKDTYCKNCNYCYDFRN